MIETLVFLHNRAIEPSKTLRFQKRVKWNPRVFDDLTFAKCQKQGGTSFPPVGGKQVPSCF